MLLFAGGRRSNEWKISAIVEEWIDRWRMKEWIESGQAISQWNQSFYQIYYDVTINQWNASNTFISRRSSIKPSNRNQAVTQSHLLYSYQSSSHSVTCIVITYTNETAKSINESTQIKQSIKTNKQPIALAFVALPQMSEEQNKTLPLFILGHSMGTLVATVAAKNIAENETLRPRFKKLVLTGKHADPSRRTHSSICLKQA